MYISKRNNLHVKQDENTCINYQFTTAQHLNYHAKFLSVNLFSVFNALRWALRWAGNGKKRVNEKNKTAEIC